MMIGVNFRMNHNLIQIESDVKFCNSLLQISGVRFAGLINSNGHLFAGGFGSNILPYEDEKNLEMLFMELVLDISMRREFDQSFGKVISVTSKREKVNITSIPINKDVLVISSDPTVNVDNLVAKATGLLAHSKKQEAILA